MPFTFSHPAIILPLSRLPKKYISLTGLVAGSVAPDFEYFFRMNIQSIYSHTLWGILYFNVPVGLMLAFVYHSLVRERFIGGLPPYISRHVVWYKNFNWSRHFSQHWLAVIVSIALGAASHILWDSFTHGPAHFTHVFGFLRITVIQTTHYRLQLYTVLQHLSSLVGLAFVLFYIKRLPASIDPMPRMDIGYWLWVCLGTAAILGLRYLLGPQMLLGDIIVSIFSASLLTMVLISLADRLRGRSRA